MASTHKRGTFSLKWLCSYLTSGNIIWELTCSSRALRSELPPTTYNEPRGEAITPANINMNFTVEAPEGTTHHGDPKLLCKPPNWQDYIAFYALNYLIHAATIPSEPGETKRETVFAVLNALFIPGFGVLRAVRRLMLRPGLRRKVPLDCASAAGALCMVVTDPGSRAAIGKEWVDNTFRSGLFRLEVPPTRKVHGICNLPANFKLYTVPFRASLVPVAGQGSTEQESGVPNSRLGLVFTPSCEYNIVKVLFSLVQAVAGGITIYRARGDVSNISHTGTHGEYKS